MAGSHCGNCAGAILATEDPMAKNYHAFILAGLFTIFSTVTISPSFAATARFTQEIKNTTASITANDLTLVFTHEPGSVFIGGGPSPTSRNHETVSWGPGDLDRPYGPNASAQIDFEGPDGTRIDKSQSFWTENRRQIIDGLASLGQPPSIMFDPGGTQATATFINPESFALVYSNVSLFRNNDLENFATAAFTTPSGQIVAGIVTSFVLNAEQSMAFPFGAIAPGTYQLASANVAPLSNPADTFFLASAAAIPEPQSCAMLLAGMALLLFVTRRRNEMRFIETSGLNFLYAKDGVRSYVAGTQKT